MPKLFTLDEANALVPVVEGLIARVRERKRTLDGFQEQVTLAMRRSTGNGHANERELKEREADAKRAADELNRAIAEMQALGCEVKDLAQGLVDFPHERDGRVVYLCWRPGEREIAWWHELEAGFAGRQPLSQL